MFDAWRKRHICPVKERINGPGSAPHRSERNGLAVPASGIGFKLFGSFFRVAEGGLMYRVILGLICVFVLGACTTSSKTYAPEGQEGYRISCSSIFLTWGSCYEKAGDICGERGYVIHMKSGGIGAKMPAGQAAYASSDRSMIIQCNDQIPPEGN